MQNTQKKTLFQIFLCKILQHHCFCNFSNFFQLFICKTQRNHYFFQLFLCSGQQNQCFFNDSFAKHLKTNAFQLFLCSFLWLNPMAYSYGFAYFACFVCFALLVLLNQFCGATYGLEPYGPMAQSILRCHLWLAKKQVFGVHALASWLIISLIILIIINWHLWQFTHLLIYSSVNHTWM